MEEIWKDIPGYEGKYQASNLGRIRSLDRTIYAMNRWGKIAPRNHKGRIYKTQYAVNNSGYLGLALGSKNSQMLHRLIALTFCKRDNESQVVNHINGIKTDNRACNLEWVSYRDNTIKSRIEQRRIGKNGDIDRVIAVLKDAYKGIRNTDLCKKYNLDRHTISRMLNGKMWPSEDYPELKMARMMYPYKPPTHAARAKIRVQKYWEAKKRAACIDT